MTLEALAALCDAELAGEGGLTIRGVSDIEQAGPEDIVFVSEPRFRDRLRLCKAGAVILPRGLDTDFEGPRLITDNPKLAFARVAAALHPPTEHGPGRHASTIIDDSARVDERASVGPFVVIAAGAQVGPGVRLAAGVKVGEGAVIGEDTVVEENAVIGAGCRLGRDCHLSPGVIIGAAGFGLARDGDRWQAIPQIGRTILGDRVEVGANTTIDRGALRDTVIGDGVKLDNLIQIGHNVEIGENTVIAAHTAVAGSTRIGARCVIGGCVGIMDHAFITDDVTIGGGSVISGEVREPGIYSSSIKADRLSDWQRNAARFRQLDELAKRVRKLEKK